MGAAYGGKHDERIHAGRGGPNHKRCQISSAAAGLRTAIVVGARSNVSPMLVNPFERGDIGPELFRAACKRALGAGLQASRSALSGLSVSALDQGPEPDASRDGGGDGYVPVIGTCDVMSALSVTQGEGRRRMRTTAIVLASILALSATSISAHSYKHSRHYHYHSMTMHGSGGSNPNGTAGGRTSLSGTGSSQFGGSVPGTSGHN
jgi:hypothetical protein